MDTSAKYHDALGANGVTLPWVVSLLLAEHATPDATALTAALTAAAPDGNVEVVGAADTLVDELVARWPDSRRPPALHGFAFPGLVAAEALAPVVLVMAFDQPDDFDPLRHALTQTWDWPEAAATAHTHRACVVLAELFTSSLPRHTRLQLMTLAVRATIGALPVRPLAVHWLPSARVIETAAWLEAVDRGADLDAGAINVRLFRMGGGQPDETVMDTTGMAAFGLPDLQCHFVKLDPHAVATVLFGYANYLFLHGDIIGDGERIEGAPAPGTDTPAQWVVRREQSLINPVRPVLDLIPGEYSAV